MRTLFVIALLLSVSFAGCASDDGTPKVLGCDPKKEDCSGLLGEGKGAIAGLLVDDRFRPLELTDDPTTEFQTTGFLLLQETGEQVQTNANGEFFFLDLEPGEYTLRGTVGGHELSPTRLQVVESVFAESTLIARRVVSDSGAIITQEYVVFVPCGYDYVANGAVTDCTFDQSGESYRPGFVVNYTDLNASFLVVEMLANQPYGYEVQLREDDGSGGGGERYAVAQFEGDYVNILLEKGQVNTVYNGQNNNVPWNNTLDMHTILFGDSAYRAEAQSIPVVGGFICCGAGVYFGIEAKFLHSLFIGDPEQDPATYCGICPPDD